MLTLLPGASVTLDPNAGPLASARLLTVLEATRGGGRSHDGLAQPHYAAHAEPARRAVDDVDPPLREHLIQPVLLW